MPAKLFYLPFRPAIDPNGLTISGAKLYFYAAGTLTPLPVYADEALTVPLDNPVEANAAGKWPAIFLDEAVLYRAVLRDEDGTILDDADPYLASVADEITPELAGVVQEAQDAAVNAATSASSASGSASAAAGSAGAASDAADTANTKAGEATARAAAASGSATTATTQAGIATEAADTAATKAGEAADSAAAAVAATANKSQAAAIGITGTAENMGAVASDLLPDNATAKALLEVLADEVEARPTSVVLASTDPNEGAKLIGLPGGVTVLDASLLPGNDDSTGHKMQVKWLKQTGSFPIENEGGIWSADTYAFFGISTEIDADTVPAPGDGTTTGGPLAGLFVFVNNVGSGGDVCGILTSAVAREDNSVVFGANFIARGDAKDGCKFVGVEIDVEPAAGDTNISSESGGLLINIFSHPISGPAILVGSLGGGSFGNGIILGGLASTAAGLALTTGAVADSLINSVPGTFSTAAVLLGDGPTKGIRWGSDGSGLYHDGTNTRQIMPAGGSWIVRNAADNASLITIDGGGNLAMNNGTIGWVIGMSSPTATGGAGTLPANPVGFLTVTIGGTIRKLPYYAS